MRSVKVAIMVALMASGTVMGLSTIAYELETGGINSASTYWGNFPAYQPGSTNDGLTVQKGSDVNWAVRVSVSGTHSGPPGDGLGTLGAANLVFDLELTKDGTTYVQNALANPVGRGGPTTGGFHSTINSTGTGAPGQTLNNAAFTTVFDVDTNQQNGGRLPDTRGNGGPRLDYYWFPTTDGLSGSGSDNPPADATRLAYTNAALRGRLVGFGAGYKNFNFVTDENDPNYGSLVDYIPGVGVLSDVVGLGTCTSNGLVPVSNPQVYTPLFEGQINTSDFDAGTYTIRLIADAAGNNILHGGVHCGFPPGYDAGSFAAKVNAVATDTITFIVEAPSTGTCCQLNGTCTVTEEAVCNASGGTWTANQTCNQIPDPCPDPPITLVDSKIFYNWSRYDGFKTTLDAAPIAGVNNDDEDAIDPLKSPLTIHVPAQMANATNYTNFAQGITGVIFDVTNAWLAAPVAGNFTFLSTGKTGTGSIPVGTTASNIRETATNPDGSKNYRVAFSFAPSSLKETWLECTVDVGAFGTAGTWKCWWGNAVADTELLNTPPNLLVNATDVGHITGNQKTAPPYLPLTDPKSKYDNNKDGLVNATDVGFCTGNQRTSPGVCVRLISR